MFKGFELFTKHLNEECKDVDGTCSTCGEKQKRATFPIHSCVPSFLNKISLIEKSNEELRKQNSELTEGANEKDKTIEELKTQKLQEEKCNEELKKRYYDLIEEVKQKDKTIEEFKTQKLLEEKCNEELRKRYSDLIEEDKQKESSRLKSAMNQQLSSATYVPKNSILSLSAAPFVPTNHSNNFSALPRDQPIFGREFMQKPQHRSGNFDLYEDN